jgi:hypothetical protein
MLSAETVGQKGLNTFASRMTIARDSRQLTNDMREPYQRRFPKTVRTVLVTADVNNTAYRCNRLKLFATENRCGILDVVREITGFRL